MPLSFSISRPEQAVGGIAVTVMGTRRKIQRVRFLNGRQHILVRCVFNPGCVREAVMVRYSGGMTEQPADPDRSEDRKAV